jgi:hypothetical protein
MKFVMHRLTHILYVAVFCSVMVACASPSTPSQLAPTPNTSLTTSTASSATEVQAIKQARITGRFSIDLNERNEQTQMPGWLKHPWFGSFEYQLHAWDATTNQNFETLDLISPFGQILAQLRLTPQIIEWREQSSDTARYIDRAELAQRTPQWENLIVLLQTLMQDLSAKKTINDQDINTPWGIAPLRVTSHFEDNSPKRMLLLIPVQKGQFDLTKDNQIKLTLIIQEIN